MLVRFINLHLSSVQSNAINAAVQIKKISAAPIKLLEYHIYRFAINSTDIYS